MGCFVQPFGCIPVCVIHGSSARTHTMFELWAHGTSVINWAVHPGTWKKGEDPKVSGRFPLENILALRVNCNCPGMMVEGILIYGRNKGLGDL